MRDKKLRAKLFGADNTDCLNIIDGVGFAGQTKTEMQGLQTKINNQQERINMLVGLLLQALPRQTLAKKLKQGEYLNSYDVENYPTVKQFLAEKIDP